MTATEKDTIHRLETLLRTRYADDTSGHDWFHLERVWYMAKKMAHGEKVNHFVLEMAALLHDVDDYKFKQMNEGELSQTTTILDRFGVGEEEKERILDIVASVSFKGAGVPTVQKTLEGKIVQDADRLDAMGAIGIARVFAFSGHKGTKMYDPRIKPNLKRNYLEYAKRGTGTAINHFYEKLLHLYDRLNTKQAKRIGKRRHRFLKNFLTEFFREVSEVS